jgi:hypothetical protein
VSALVSALATASASERVSETGPAQATVSASVLGTAQA